MVVGFPRLLGGGSVVVANEAGTNTSAAAERVALLALGSDRGARFTPGTTGVTTLHIDLLGARVTTFRESGLDRVAMREHALDLVELPSSGNPRGSVTAQIPIADGRHGIHGSTSRRRRRRRNEPCPRGGIER